MDDYNLDDGNYNDQEDYGVGAEDGNDFKYQDNDDINEEVIECLIKF